MDNVFYIIELYCQQNKLYFSLVSLIYIIYNYIFQRFALSNLISLIWWQTINDLIIITYPTILLHHPSKNLSTSPEHTPLRMNLIKMVIPLCHYKSLKIPLGHWQRERENFEWVSVASRDSFCQYKQIMTGKFPKVFHTLMVFDCTNSSTPEKNILTFLLWVKVFEFSQILL